MVFLHKRPKLSILETGAELGFSRVQNFFKIFVVFMHFMGTTFLATFWKILTKVPLENFKGKVS